MDIISWIMLVLASHHGALSYLMKCSQEMNYYIDYGYGYVISCNNLTDTEAPQLQNMEVSNEIKLKISNSTITKFTADLFQNIPDIRQIFICNSTINFTKGTPAFGGLDALEILCLKDDNLTTVSKHMFGRLSNLKILNLTNNSLQEFENGSLVNLTSLQTLDLANNKLQHVNSIPFCEVPTLKHIFMQNNQIRSISKSILSCFESLRTLYLDFNEIHSIPRLPPLPFLSKLSLSYNKIEDVRNSFGDLKNLKELNLEGNILITLDPNDFLNLKNLIKLSIKHNFLNETIVMAAVQVLPAMKNLDLESNRLNHVRFPKISSLETLSLSNNGLSPSTFKELQNVQKLLTLRMRNCSLEVLPDYAFEHLGHLEFLDLSHNKLTLTSISLHGLHNLKQLIFSENAILSLPNYCFHLVPNLQVLDISFNGLKSINSATFHNLSNLRVLNISYNHLQRIEEVNLATLDNLEILDLEGNQLQYIDYDDVLSRVSYLKLMNIKANRFTCSFLSQMVRYFKSKNIRYTVNGKQHYEEENVAGIYCHEDYTFNQSLKRTENIEPTNAVVSKIYRREEKQSENVQASLGSSVLILLTVFIILIVCLCAVYRLRSAASRRRALRGDSVELFEVSSQKLTYDRLV